MNTLVRSIESCTICIDKLDHDPRPVISVHPKSKILIIGQAPGTKVHNSGIPWDDKSGDNLRNWLGVDHDQFYNPENFGIVPMGFCYPGKGKSGDLPPRPECAPQWHEPLLNMMSEVQLTLLIGMYAQKYYLKATRLKTLTETVQNFQSYLPTYLPLVHPSPRNFIWMRKNPWFEKDLIPKLRLIIQNLI